MISHKHRCVFIHLPKCGGQSIEDVFISDCGLGWDSREPLLLRKNENKKVGPPWLAHLTYREYLDYSYLSPDLMGEYFKFTVVRNPYDRLVSIYKYLGYCYVMSFSDFINNEMTAQLNRNSARNYFFKPQVDFLVNDKGDISVDEVVHLERISEQMPAIFSRFGVNMKSVPHVNASPESDIKFCLKNKIKYLKKGVFSLKMKHQVEWSSDLRKTVLKFYKCDFEAFGYQGGLDL